MLTQVQALGSRPLLVGDADSLRERKTLKASASALHDALTELGDAKLLGAATEAESMSRPA